METEAQGDGHPLVNIWPRLGFTSGSLVPKSGGRLVASRPWGRGSLALEPIPVSSPHHSWASRRPRSSLQVAALKLLDTPRAVWRWVCLRCHRAQGSANNLRACGHIQNAWKHECRDITLTQVNTLSKLGGGGKGLASDRVPSWLDLCLYCPSLPSAPTSSPTLPTFAHVWCAHFRTASPCTTSCLSASFCASDSSHP